MKQYILAHDLGTSGNKATLYDFDGSLTGSMVCGYLTYYPSEGCVEQDANDWWRAVCESTRALLEQTGISASQVACVAFSAQMMGCLLVDGDGNPLRNSMIWADTRSSRQEKYMLERVDLASAYRITGHRLSASYSAAKLLWVRDNQPEVYKNADKMLQAKEYIILKLTGQAVTEYSDAGGTNLLDISKKEWSDDLLKAFNIRKELLPELYPSAHIAGGVTAEAAALCGLLEGTPVVIGGGDGTCATVGAGVVRVGKIYNVIGSSSWFSTVTPECYFDPEMRTFNWVHMDENLYTPCGTMQSAGFSYAWLRDTMCGEEKQESKSTGVSAYKLIDRLVEKTPAGAGGLLFLPYLLGERSPHWDHAARGAFIGLGMSAGKSEMARAVLEGVGFNLKIILSILEGIVDIKDIIMIGGGTKGDTWLQILADIWQKPLHIPQYLEEATSLGAAICGGVGIGLYPDYLVAEKLNKAVRIVEPRRENAGVYSRMYGLFCDAYSQLKPIYGALSEIVN